MNDVQWRPSDGGRADDLLNRLDVRSGLDSAGTAHVRVYGELAFGGDAEHINHFETRGAGRVLNSHTDAERSSINLFAQPLLYPDDLFGSGGLAGGRAAFGQDFRDSGSRVSRIRI